MGRGRFFAAVCFLIHDPGEPRASIHKECAAINLAAGSMRSLLSAEKRMTKKRKPVSRTIAVLRRGVSMAALFVQFATVQTALAKDGTWLRVTTPEFTLFTDLKEKQAVAWAAEFTQYIAALRGYFLMQDRHLPPLTIVVFEWERDFLDYRPLDLHGKPQAMDGFFSRQESWAVAGLAGGQMSDEVRRKVFHEGTHWFMSVQNRPNPLWLEEGLAEVFSTFAVTNGHVEWGRMIKSHLAVLGPILPVPLEKLLVTGHTELFADESSRTGYFYAESWLFVHFLMFGHHDFPRSALADYKVFLSSGVAPNLAFQRAFGRTYAKMEDQLFDYLRSGEYSVQRQPLAVVGELRAEQATKRDTEEALGRLALVGRRWEIAEEHARAVTSLAPEDPRAFEILGLARLGRGDAVGSIDAFSRAAKLNSRDFFPYFELAHAEHAEGTTGPMGLSSITPEAARRMANLYEQAINLHARFLPSFRGLVGLVGIAEPWSVEDMRFLELGQKLFPQDEFISVGLAVLSWRAGEREKARSQLAAILATEQQAGGSDARNYARRLDMLWAQQGAREKRDQPIQTK
jgi:hypothetical protein